MSNVKFTQDNFYGADYKDLDGNEYTLITMEVLDWGRWDRLDQYIFQSNETKKYFALYCRSGLTEYQEDEFPDLDEDDNIDLFPVTPKTKEVTYYE